MQLSPIFALNDNTSYVDNISTKSYFVYIALYSHLSQSWELGRGVIETPKP